MICILLFIAAAGMGCVKRRLYVRSNPEGAPVWIDENYAGLTPLDYSFKHYGARRVRVGPVRGETGKTLYQGKESVYRLKAPWYQKFPLDFFFEVLWPFNMEDVHTFDVDLTAPADPEELDMETVIRQVLQEARDYRRKSGYLPERLNQFHGVESDGEE